MLSAGRAQYCKAYFAHAIYGAVLGCVRSGTRHLAKGVRHKPRIERL